MKEFEQYGLRKDEEWEWLPWLPWPPESRPPFKIWVIPEDIAPFFFVEHHPYALSLLLKIADGFKADIFHKMGLEGTSKDWEALATGLIIEWEENNSGEDLFHFDSDEDIFCVYSQHIDDMLSFAKTLREACDDENRTRNYLDCGLKEWNNQN